MLWLKAFHVIAVVTWFAGLFYLPRLYLYHAGSKDTTSRARFEIMERRLFVIMTIGATLSVLFGVMMLIQSPGYLAMGWLRAKLPLVLLLIVYHGYCFKLMRELAEGRKPRTAGWYRLFNEVPTVLLIAVVILAVVKPF
jgi:protoporphyrinogen IX oxidase